MARTINWTGQSGSKYNYRIFEIDTSFKAIAGNYAFAKETKPKSWIALYFGETEDFSTRFSGHHKIDHAIRNGATHIHVHPNSDTKSRLSEEADLIGKHNPVSNG